MVIAIDGPAGSGKTTTAKLLAKKLGILYLDTGATYRALTLKAIRENIKLDDEDKLSLIAGNMRIKFENERVFVDGNDVTDAIREPEIDRKISMPVSFRKVRERMVEIQRNIAKGKDAVVEGRDITTVVFPGAEYKFYLDAAIKERANRRYKELLGKGKSVNLKEVEEQMRLRDSADLNRKIGPLKKAPDAIVIDTTRLSRNAVLDRIISYVRSN